MNRFSRIFQPIGAVAKDANLSNKDFTSKSQRLMLELGIIHQTVPGCYDFLPMGMRALNKLTNIVDEEMQRIDSQKLIFSTLVKANLWEKSGRANEMGAELITFNDRHKQKYILGPTHEETASNLIATLPLASYKKYPLLIYQITSKFRDEMKPRFGIIRGREFLMKDLYSFDITVGAALETYEKVCQSYDRIFTRIGVEFIKARGSSGTMGGDLSHEYHYLADIGDDKLLVCKSCKAATNFEIVQQNICPNCGESSSEIHKAIEVGHTFFLGDKYSKPLKAEYLDETNKRHSLQMGSYGIGISRLLGAALECLSLDQELRWPDSIAPYNLVIIPSKKGSKEEQYLENVDTTLYNQLESIESLRNNIIIDDRLSYSIGRRLVDCKRSGIRFILVLNKRSHELQPIYELNDIVLNEKFEFSLEQIIDYIKNQNQIDIKLQNSCYK